MGEFPGSAVFVTRSFGYVTTKVIYSQGVQIEVTIVHVAGKVLEDHERFVNGNREGVCSRRKCTGYTKRYMCKGCHTKRKQVVRGKEGRSHPVWVSPAVYEVRMRG